MKKISFIILFLFWAIPSGFAQLKSYSFEEAEQLSKENPKPIVVFIHTSWCKYCKMMENSSFKNPEVVMLLNSKFYFVSFDTETKNTINFHNYNFKFKPTGNNTGIRELATALATINNEIVYPTITVLDTEFSILYQKQSYFNASALLYILEKIK